MRVEVTNQIRGILKTFGIVLSRRTGEPFERLVIEACGEGASIGGRLQSAQLGTLLSKQPSCRVDFARRQWHERAAHLGLGMSG